MMRTASAGSAATTEETTSMQPELALEMELELERLLGWMLTVPIGKARMMLQ